MKTLKKEKVVGETPPRKYPQEVYEIHRAFETAGERLLEEARTILKGCEAIPLEKGERLLKLGFKNTSEAVITTDIKNKKNMRKS